MSKLRDDIVFEAMPLEPCHRAAFLDEVCHGDAELRADVEALLRVHDDYPEPRDPPSRSGTGARPRRARPERVGPYRVDRELGRGGMGRVYLAHDPGLDRFVAIKMLPEEVADAPRRADRLRHEASLLAQLTHPHIATIYRFDVDDDGYPYLVMEYAEGETLDVLLRSGPRSLDDAMRIGAEIAEALAAAHGQAIIHRDLKPANVVLDGGRSVKLVDFGLARMRLASSEPVDATAGLDGVQGSPGYASPEQLRGAPTGPATDAWAFGCVLFELVTGRPAFPGKDPLERFRSVLDGTPDWSALPPSVPPRVTDLLRRCLDPSPDRRLHDLSVAAETLRAPGAVAGGRRRPRMWATAAALAVLVTLIVSGTLWEMVGGGERASAEPAPHASSALSERQLTFDGEARLARLSPDGRILAFVVGGTRIVFLDLESKRERTALRCGRVHRLTWTGDGRLVAVTTDGRGGGDRVSVALRPFEDGHEVVGPVNLCIAASSPDGERFLGTRRPPGGGWGLQIHDPGRNTLVDLPLPVEFVSAPAARWSPVGDVLLLSGNEPGRTEPVVWLYSLETHEATRILEGHEAMAPLWSPDGTAVLFTSDERLMSLRLSEATLRPAGPPVTLVDRFDAHEFSVAAMSDGRLQVVYVDGTDSATLWYADSETGRWEEPPEWQPLTQGTFSEVHCTMSNDGNRVVYIRLTDGDGVYTADLPALEAPAGPWRTEVRRWHFSETNKRWPALSPDGARIIFAERGVGLRMLDLNSRILSTIVPGGAPAYVYWLRDGRILFQRFEERERNFRLLDLATGEERPVLPTMDGGTLFHAAPSPDGRRLAVAGNRGASQSLQVWLIDLDDGTERLLHDGWAAPFQWSPDGRFVFLLTDDPDHTPDHTSVHRLEVETGEIEWLFDCPGEIGQWANLTMSADNRRLTCSVMRREADIHLITGISP